MTVYIPWSAGEIRDVNLAIGADEIITTCQAPVWPVVDMGDGTGYIFWTVVLNVW